MRKIPFGVVAALSMMAGGFSTSALRAQETFALIAPVESPDFPNLNTELIIEGDVGQAFEFTANLSISSANVTGAEGPQGWSYGIHNSGVDILATTIAGTVTADKSEGGLADIPFVVSDLIKPEKNGGKQGMTQAVVLSLTKNVSLPPNTTQIVAKNRYKATIAAAESTGSLKYEDGLVGDGQPVQNNITFKGNTAIPTSGETRITIRKKVVAEPEAGHCNDGVDNDLDGKTDCADSDCDADPVFCPLPETGHCTDGKDNDKDGKTDCDDDDCKGKDPACPAAPPTKGFDLILSAEGSHKEGNKNVVDFLCDEADASVVAIVSIEKTHDDEPKGAQGWSIAIGHDKDNLTIEGPTSQGTDAAALFKGEFEQTEIIDPAKNGGKAGFVSAIVISLTKGTTLDPTKNQSIARATYKLASTALEEDFPQMIQFTNGLIGSGVAVDNLLTIDGNTVVPSNLINLALECKEGAPPDGDFIRGNANDDGKVNIADPIWIINELVREGPKTKCQDAADANDDGLVDLSDAMYLITWRFLGGPAPTAPFAACGPDPKEDTLTCAEGSATSCP